MMQGKATACHRPGGAGYRAILNCSIPGSHLRLDMRLHSKNPERCSPAPLGRERAPGKGGGPGAAPPWGCRMRGALCRSSI